MKTQNVFRQPTAHAETAREIVYKEDRKRICNHMCKNKDRCGHECCKTGVKTAPCSGTVKNSNISSYICDLRTRNVSSTAPPVKRLKMKMENESRTLDLTQFAYTAKASVPMALSCEKMTEHSSTPAQDWDYLDAFVRSRQQTQSDYYEKDFSAWKHSAGHSQSGLTVNAQNKPNEILKKSNTDPDDSDYWSTEFINVTFDLGCDAWDDYDDDNLVHASSISAMDPKPCARSKNDVLSDTAICKPLMKETQNQFNCDASDRQVSKHIILLSH
ncbi:probable ATP-dependent DNA helicase HFM1 [Protopterus annectens]|uniref:probable ATP-dependent DNA helicase HFM1 n=1 Tax=Protopterus annectens TaxID=7888 RepID=UPI001CFB7248|nr:probable ATP-dependent DNA helicase HFM1 [Protopterus annectens]